jgi:uncharacterized repeat protein (TIGR03803 family)
MANNRWKRSLGRVLALAVVALTVCAAGHAAPRYKVLHAFGAGKDGAGLWGSVALDKKGNLYGATSGGGAYGQGIVFRLTPRPGGNWTESILHNFPSSLHDGEGPNGGLLQDDSGIWYGTTAGGGAYYLGTVFQLKHGSGGWVENILYSFGTHSDDGYEPAAGLAMDKRGNLYGTAPQPWSTAFELTPGSGGWDETIMHHFGVSKGDGAGPYAGLILDAVGNLYGTTEGGGNECGSSGCGTVYELSPEPNGKWKEAVLHRFDNNGHDGFTPGFGTLVLDGSGSLYGTTAGGGCCGGVVYQLTPGASGRWNETILYDFKGGSKGFEPGAGVVMDKAGNSYGTTIYGGSGCDCGVVYKLAPTRSGKWKYTVLHTFVGSDGAQPRANLILDDKGNLYGTTITGGAYGGGVVFELTP